MHVTISTRNLSLPGQAETHLDRKVARLKKRLKHFNPDLLELSVVLEKVHNRNEFRTTVTCRLPMRTLRVQEVEGSETRSLNKSFDVLERQLDRFLSHLRREDSFRR